MRGRALPVVVFTLLSAQAHAQAVWQPTPAPVVTAESTSWFRAGEPVTWDGAIYVSAGARRPFNANVMVRSGVFRGIPLYTDATIEPFTVVLVPLPGGWMQPYERRAVAINLETRQAAGPPTFGPAYVLSGAQSDAPVTPAIDEPSVSHTPSPIGTSGRLAPTPTRPVTTVIPPTGANTIWVNFDGRRWYAANASIEYDAAQLNEIGRYYGWVVYAKKSDTGPPDTIYIPSTPGRLSAYGIRQPNR